MQLGIIYAVKNCVTDHIYIGQTKRTLKRRWDRHKQDARNGSDVPLHRAIRKHGVESFTIEELCTVPIEWLDAVEIGFIHLLGTFGRGYNATPGGDGTGSGPDHPLFGKKRPESVGKKISETRIRKGIRHDKETIERIAAGKRGKKLNYSPEGRASKVEKMSGENNPFFGKVHPPEVLEKMRAAHLGTKQSTETIAKRAKAMTGTKWKNSNSDYIGVFLDKKSSRWRVCLRIEGKQKQIGTFNTELEAAAAYNAYVTDHGLDRPLNIIPLAA